MTSGEEYDGSDPHLLDILNKTREVVRDYNDLRPNDNNGKDAILSKLLGKKGQNCIINQPFYCDYGVNIEVGENFFANYNFTVLDEAKVKIGDNAFIASNVSIYTAGHPLSVRKRNALIQYAKSVTIGNNVWIGGDVTIVPGVTIGNNVTIGAGSVVTKDVPDNVVVAGNPARVIRSIPEE
ncbi:MAG: sugar O-acetyltransferase [Bacteroidales bacterium]|nr:sugar O-acetyltransferase [Bacteroidales bacterium]